MIFLDLYNIIFKNRLLNCRSFSFTQYWICLPHLYFTKSYHTFHDKNYDQYISLPHRNDHQRLSKTSVFNDFLKPPKVVDVYPRTCNQMPPTIVGWKLQSILMFLIIIMKTTVRNNNIFKTIKYNVSNVSFSSSVCICVFQNLKTISQNWKRIEEQIDQSICKLHD